MFSNRCLWYLGFDVFNEVDRIARYRIKCMDHLNRMKVCGIHKQLCNYKQKGRPEKRYVGLTTYSLICFNPWWMIKKFIAYIYKYNATIVYYKMVWSLSLIHICTLLFSLPLTLMTIVGQCVRLCPRTSVSFSVTSTTTAYPFPSLLLLAFIRVWSSPLPSFLPCKLCIVRGSHVKSKFPYFFFQR